MEKDNCKGKITGDMDIGQRTIAYLVVINYYRIEVLHYYFYFVIYSVPKVFVIFQNVPTEA